VIAETHSEHLLLRLRTLIAQGVVDEDDVALYFLRNDGGLSEVAPVPISDDGRIRPADWPRGFFQESTKEALALATEQAKRRSSAR